MWLSQINRQFVHPKVQWWVLAVCQILTRVLVHQQPDKPLFIQMWRQSVRFTGSYASEGQSSGGLPLSQKLIRIMHKLKERYLPLSLHWNVSTLAQFFETDHKAVILIVRKPLNKVPKRTSWNVRVWGPISARVVNVYSRYTLPSVWDGQQESQYKPAMGECKTTSQKKTVRLNPRD